MAENNNVLENIKARAFDENTPVGKFLIQIRNYFAEMPKKKRNIVLGVAGGVVALAAVLAIVLNATGDKYVTLYEGLETTEANAIYQILVADGIDAQMDSTGNVVVPVENYDACLLQLAAQGYPKSTLTYDIFESSTGLTATESEKKQALVHQTQNRLQDTLKRLDCVEDAVVTLAIAETTDYVWQQAEDESATTASVTITFKEDMTLTDEQITAVKNLVASAVPRLTPDNVSLIDSKTMLELKVSDDLYNGISYTQNLEFEQYIQNKIEANVRRILEPRYGKDGVVAVAKVTINYDKMMTEKLELLPNSNNQGFLTHEEGTFQGDGDEVAGGIAGEENNTDIPDYTYDGGTALDNDVLVEGLRDYDYGYIKTQIESGNAILDRATVSVMVKQANLSEATKEELIDLVSKSADIPPESISVSSFVGETIVDEPVVNNGFFAQLTEKLPTWAIVTIFAIAAVFILLLIFIPVLLYIRHKKKKKKDGMEEYLQQIEDERAAEQLQLQQEIDRYKKELADLAMGDADPKDEAILKEVRNFAKANPKVTANLLRSWIKEGDD